MRFYAFQVSLVIVNKEEKYFAPLSFWLHSYLDALSGDATVWILFDALQSLLLYTCHSVWLRAQGEGNEVVGAPILWIIIPVS